MEVIVIFFYSEILVFIKIVGRLCGEFCGIVGLLFIIKFLFGVMVGKILVDVQRDYILVRMVSLINELRQIFFGIGVVICEFVGSLSLFKQCDFYYKIISLDEGLLEYFKYFYYRSVNGLIDN